MKYLHVVRETKGYNCRHTLTFEQVEEEYDKNVGLAAFVFGLPWEQEDELRQVKSLETETNTYKVLVTEERTKDKAQAHFDGLTQMEREALTEVVETWRSEEYS
ncbi:hypothetical protein LCGC14_2803000 [marine sediment metagenome]|uniref:Uncharacterized protein n=1 Tax=marine sediment metagenome TaxID=412755 RepID=A0A0F8YM88_9ZZZZ